MKKSLLTLFLLFLGCAAQAHAGSGVHAAFVGSGGHVGFVGHTGFSTVAFSGGHIGFSSHFYGYPYSYRRAYLGYGYPYYYSSFGYGGYYGGYDDYPTSYDSYDVGSQYAVYPSSPDTAPDSTGTPPNASAKATIPATPPPVAPKQPLNQIPYGFDIGTKLIKSPWSGFVINGANRPPEQVVYDANTGQAFRIPPPQ